MALTEQRCQPCHAGTPALTETQIRDLLTQVPDWELSADGQSISRLFNFETYLSGLNFVNATAAIAQSENHHPDIELLYKKAKVTYTTHAIHGLSDNDFICAAKVDALLGNS